MSGGCERSPWARCPPLSVEAGQKTMPGSTAYSRRNVQNCSLECPNFPKIALMGRPRSYDGCAAIARAGQPADHGPDRERSTRGVRDRMDRSQRYTLGTHPTGGQGRATGTSGHDGLRETAGQRREMALSWQHCGRRAGVRVSPLAAPTQSSLWLALPAERGHGHCQSDCSQKQRGLKGVPA
jgi:hypothetical protein